MKAKFNECDLPPQQFKFILVLIMLTSLVHLHQLRQSLQNFHFFTLSFNYLLPISQLIQALQSLLKLNDLGYVFVFMGFLEY